MNNAHEMFYGIISIHAPVKGATYDIPGMTEYVNISIHAPVKGATRWPRSSPEAPRNFNPRSREGSDWLEAQLCDIGHLYFNPRSREGSDPQFRGRDHHGNAISIHAPVKGATTGTPAIRPSQDYFNPRSREGSDWLGGTA